MKLDRRKILLLIIAISVIITAISLIYRSGCFSSLCEEDIEEIPEAAQSEYLYGICIDSLNTVYDVIKPGESLSVILGRIGLTGADIDKIVKASKGVFNLKDIRSGNSYTVFSTNDSLNIPKYLVYEHNVKDFYLFNLGDSVSVNFVQKEVVSNRKTSEGIITSSLYGAIQAGGMNIGLATKLEDIYQWSIDFYGVQEGDNFKVIYDELSIDGKCVGIGTVWGAIFNHNGKEYYAIRYEDEATNYKGYWDIEGKSLKKLFLKAPLNFSRISSRFSNSRMHPVLRIRRPHHGVDYAAPSGTPVRAVADGRVIQRSYDTKGGGNMLKIKHTKDLTTGYLHLKGYAKGIVVGKQVSQGDIIGYVGSTGTSTGPHLDYRVWRGGKAVDPLKMTSEKGEDINSKYKNTFMQTKERIIAELEGREYTLPVKDSTMVFKDSVNIKNNNNKK